MKTTLRATIALACLALWPIALAGQAPAAKAKYNAPAVKNLRLAKDQIDLAKVADKTVFARTIAKPEEFAANLDVLANAVGNTKLDTAYSKEIRANSREMAKLLGKTKLTKIEQIRLEGLLLDMDTKGRHATMMMGSGNFTAPLQVKAHTFDREGKEVKSLRVFYRRAPDPEDQATVFLQLSSPTEAEIKAGCYYFWCQTDETTPKKGPANRFEIWGDKPIKLDLTAP